MQFLLPRLIALSIAAVALGTPPVFAQGADGVVGAAWDKGPPFAGDEEVRESISGAACTKSNPPNCLAALDEGRAAQFFHFAGKTLVPDRVIRLLPDAQDGISLKEADTEGVAYADGFFYLIGSHGLSRSKGKFKPSSFFVFRFPVGQTDGKPTFEFSADTVAPQIQRSAILRDVLKTMPPVKDFAEKPLGAEPGGVNIEGLAVKGNRMFLGLRAPSLDKTAFILGVNVDGVFEGKPLAPKIHPVALGQATGIRDLAAVDSGLLILAGPVQDSGPYAVFHWDPASNTLRKLQALAMPKTDAKAETLLVLEDAGTRYRVLLMYDGIEDGGPREIDLR